MERRVLLDGIDEALPCGILPGGIGLHRGARLLAGAGRAGICATTLAMLAGCGGALSTIDPAGPYARSVATMWWVMLGGAVILAGIVFVLLALVAYALVVGIGTLPTADARAVEVRVTARQYAWDVVHSGGVRTRDVIHIPAGRPADLVVTSTDVIHSLWIPRLAGKMDAIPGHTNRLRVIADTPGTYRGECAEYCGVGHKDHGLTVVAHDAAGWAAFTGGRE